MVLVDTEPFEKWKNSLVEILKLIPKENITFLKYLFNFLHKVSLLSHCNQMTPLSLAEVFTLSLIYPQQDSSLAFWNIVHLNTIVIECIKNAPKIFGEVNFDKLIEQSKIIAEQMQKGSAWIREEYPQVKLEKGKVLVLSENLHRKIDRKKLKIKPVSEEKDHLIRASAPNVTTSTSPIVALINPLQMSAIGLRGIYFKLIFSF